MCYDKLPVIVPFLESVLCNFGLQHLLVQLSFSVYTAVSSAFALVLMPGCVLCRVQCLLWWRLWL